jgi:ABC-type protease/lipase transport system fused ATPase/permease subunit
MPALQLADQVLVLRDGAVAAYGPPAEVLAPLRPTGAPGVLVAQPA